MSGGLQNDLQVVCGGLQTAFERGSYGKLLWNDRCFLQVRAFVRKAAPVIAHHLGLDEARIRDDDNEALVEHYKTTASAALTMTPRAEAVRRWYALAVATAEVVRAKIQAMPGARTKPAPRIADPAARLRLIYIRRYSPVRMRKVRKSLAANIE